jgi:6-phosphogluconolactonase (cycloisomerase 2 family)
VDELRNARNVTVSPDGAYVYAVADLDDSIVTFARNSTTGKLTTWQELVDDTGLIDGLDDARGVAASADGQNVYVSGHVDDAVAVFTRLPNGTLDFRNRVKNGEQSGGKGVGGTWELPERVASSRAGSAYVPAFAYANGLRRVRERSH